MSQTYVSFSLSCVRTRRDPHWNRVYWDDALARPLHV